MTVPTNYRPPFGWWQTRQKKDRHCHNSSSAHQRRTLSRVEPQRKSIGSTSTKPVYNPGIDHLVQFKSQMVRQKTRWLLVTLDVATQGNPEESNTRCHGGPLADLFQPKKGIDMLLGRNLTLCFGLSAEGVALQTQGVCT